MQKGIEIKGSVFSNEGDIGHNEFLDAFIEFIESKGWQFGGGTKQVNEDGTDTENIDEIE